MQLVIQISVRQVGKGSVVVLDDDTARKTFLGPHMAEANLY